MTFEAPFVVLLLGSERAMLLDSGAVDDRTLRRTVDDLIASWRAAHPRETYPLVVAHTHAHRDHRAGDRQFSDRPDTVVIGTDVASVRQFFGFTDWPAEVVTFELGERTLEITGVPGHHETSVALYDPWSGLLLTGDTVYPGRLYVQDTPAFTDSLRRMVAFAEAREVTHVLGCHVEMTRTPGRSPWAIGSPAQKAVTGIRIHAGQPPAGYPFRYAVDHEHGAVAAWRSAELARPSRETPTRRRRRGLAAVTAGGTTRSEPHPRSSSAAGGWRVRTALSPEDPARWRPPPVRRRR